MRTWLLPLLLLLPSPLLSGCFKEPKPKCSFLCGAAGECPEGYVCGTDDQRCHLLVNGAPAVCEEPLPPDGAGPADGAADASADAAPLPDGVPDAAEPPDAEPPDAEPPDAPDIDAEIADAPPD